MHHIGRTNAPSRARSLLVTSALLLVACTPPLASTPVPAVPRVELAPAAASPPSGVPASPPSDGSVAEAAATGTAMVLALRSERGLPAVATRDDLSAFARRWAATMRDRGFAHSPSASRDALLIGGRTRMGENIAWHSDSSMSPARAATLFHEMWVDSPGHLRNLVDDSWTAIGVGFHHDDSGWWAVQVFSNG